MTVYNIPLSPQPQVFSIELAAITYRLRFYWNDAENGGWIMDIASSTDIPIVQGIPLVTGTDLLAQYNYLGFGGAIFVQTPSDEMEPPTFSNLGVGSFLLFLTTVVA